MSLQERVRAGCYGTVGIVALLATFFTVAELMVFLSNPAATAKTPNFPRGDFWISASWSLFIDQILISLFLLQHSLLVLPEIKNWLASSLKLQVLQRSIYVILTTVALQILMKYWQNVPEVTLWNVNTNVKLYWWAFITIHALAWAVVYVGNICMDVNELLGIKQIYYRIQNLPDPNSYKSRELKRLYAHMRHPSFLGFLIILWVVPCMSLDRLLLASICTTYMYLAWNTEPSDYRYQHLQFVKKFHEFNYVK